MSRFLKDNRKILILAGLLVGQLAIVSLQVPLGDQPSFFERGVFFLFAPLERVVHGVFDGAGRIWSRYIYLRHVEIQNQEMRDELFHLRQENILLRNELVRLKDIRDIEGVLGGKTGPFLVASVIGLDAANAYKSIVIDKGSRDGLKANMAVIDRNGNLVGRVVNPVSLRESMVQLVTDDNSAVNVRSAKSGVLGQLAGDVKNGRCVLKYVLASDESLAEGEELITTGYDKIYPPGVKAGRVVSIVADSSLFQKIEVRPYLNFRDLSRVAVLTRLPGERP
jgi:rod shape-determining protein MreC